jgi:hypothetical protein
VTVESFSRGARCHQARRLAIEQIEQRRRRLGRVVKGPEPSLDAVVAELGDGSDVTRHNGKASGHGLDDRQ